MGTIDYSMVADRYENNKIRHRIEVDPLLVAIQSTQPVILDLGCGTGLYLETQTVNLGIDAARWYGVDPSPSMLGVAKKKGFPWDLREGRAESLPFEEAYFDYIVCRYAFHHFVDKNAALREIDRVLKSGGVVRFENLIPESSADFWIYHYFPGTIAADAARFWPISKIEKALSKLCYTYKLNTELLAPLPAGALLNEARNRETSHLHLISNHEYTEGLTAIEHDLASNPDRLVDPGLMIGNLIAQKFK